MNFFILMKILFFLLLVLFHDTAFGQSHIIPELQKICPINLGDSVEEVSNLFICSDAVRIKSTNTQNLPCRIFKYVPAKTQPINFGKISFDNVSVLVNEKGLIKSIDFSKWYALTDSADVFNQIKHDCNELIHFLGSYYNEPKSKKEVHSSDNIDMETYIWKREYYKIIVQKEIFKKNKIRTKSVMVLTITPRK